MLTDGSAADFAAGGVEARAGLLDERREVALADRVGLDGRRFAGRGHEQGGLVQQAEGGVHRLRQIRQTEVERRLFNCRQGRGRRDRTAWRRLDRM